MISEEMKVNQQDSITNRHIAKCLSNVEALCPEITSMAKIAIKTEMRYLANDLTQVTQDKRKEIIYDQEISEENYNR